MPDAHIPSDSLLSSFDRNRRWLASLTAGDEVAMQYGWSGHRLHKVDRTTETQIIIGADRFRRTDGYQVGSSGYRRPHIYEPTDEIREAVLRDDLIQIIQRAKFETMETEKLRAVVAVLQGAECK